MAIRVFRCNLKASRFPLLTHYFGRSVASRGPDDTDYVVTDSYTGTAANDEIGIPMPIYMHNVVPVSHGLQSVGYVTNLDYANAEETDFDQAIVLRASNENTHLLVPASGRNYINYNGTTWNPQYPNTIIKYGGPVTKAYVQQRTFVCYRRNGVFEYNSVTNVLDPIVLNGITDTELDGICYSNNFLIAYTSDTVFWSSVTDPTDFIPNLSNGANSSKLVFARGAIVSVLPIHNGYVIYTTHNAISAYWSGNLNAPWVFREIPGSAGITNPEHVSHDSNYDKHFAWTTSGLMQISKEGAILTFPEITDFLTCGYMEDYIGDVNPTGQGTKEFVPWWLAAEKQLKFTSKVDNLMCWKYQGQLRIKVAFVGSRYVAVSYGVAGQLTHILVFDLALRRWGKLRINHVDVFEYTMPGEQLNFNVKHSFGILQANGTIQTVDFTHEARATDAVILYGRVQHQRAAQSILYSTEVDGVLKEDLRLTWLPTYDGATLLPDYHPMPVIKNSNTVKYSGRFTARSFVIKILGSFSLSNLQFNLESAGGNR